VSRPVENGGSVAGRTAGRYARGRGMAVVVGVAVAGALGACSGAPLSTGPKAGAACAPSGTVSLAVLQGTTLDCTSGTTVTLAGNGATYLIVPEFAVGDVPYTGVPYTIGRRASPGAPTALAAGRPPASALVSTATRPGVNVRQAEFDLRLRAADRQRLAALGAARTRGTLALQNPGVHTRATCPSQSTRTFQVVANSNGTTFKSSTATLAYCGTNVIVYIDNAAPPGGFTPQQLTQFGQYADQVLYPLDLGAFGSPTDIDHNGAVIMLLTPIVNALTPKADCATSGFVAGFFDGLDLDDTASANSNKGEIFYQVVPDTGGTVSCKHSLSEVEGATAPTFLHELQHMISNGQHVLVHGGQPEEGWLDEGMSIVATELGSRYYEAKFPPPTGRTNPVQMFPDSAEPFINEQLLDSYSYLTAPDTQSVTLHSDADNGLDWRGGDWLLLRYIGDQFDSTVYAKMEHSTSIGTANIAQATGQSFPTLFANFGLALYTDSIVGAARNAVPPQDRFVSRNLRAIYQALYNGCTRGGGCPGVGSPFPITLQSLSGGSSVAGSLVPGAEMFYQLATPSGQSTVTVVFAPASGATFSATLHTQISIFRLQ